MICRANRECPSMPQYANKQYHNSSEILTIKEQTNILSLFIDCLVLLKQANKNFVDVNLV